MLWLSSHQRVQLDNSPIDYTLGYQPNRLYTRFLANRLYTWLLAQQIIYNWILAHRVYPRILAQQIIHLVSSQQIIHLDTSPIAKQLGTSPIVPESGLVFRIRIGVQQPFEYGSITDSVSRIRAATRTILLFHFRKKVLLSQFARIQSDLILTESNIAGDRQAIFRVLSALLSKLLR